jgi:hypothetical protein
MTAISEWESVAVVAQAEAIAWAALKANETLAQALRDARACGFTREQLYVAEAVVRRLYEEYGGLE